MSDLGEPVSVTGAIPVPVLLVFFLAAIGVAHRTRHRAGVYLGIALLIPMAAGVFAVAQTIGGMYEYRLRWVWVLGALATAFAVSEAARLIRPHLSAPWVQTVSALSVVGLVVVASIGTSDATAMHPVGARHAAEVKDLARQVVRHLPDGPGVVLVRTDGTFPAAVDFPGLILNLERAGVRVRMPYTSPLRLIWGEQRMYRHGTVRARLLLTGGDLVERTNALRIAVVSDFTPKRRARAMTQLSVLQARGAKPFSRAVTEAKRHIQGLAVYIVPASGY